MQAASDALPSLCGTGPAGPRGLARLILPEVMTSRYASVLASDLKALRGGSVVLDVSSVRQIGTLCLQVLISARRTWSFDGYDFSLSGDSEELAKRWAMFEASRGETTERAG